MKAAALLALLAALPGQAAETVTPAQARSNVVAALPPDIARGAGQGDLRAYLERLGPEQKAAALRSLTAKEGDLGDDPTTLGVIGEAYAGLGKVKEARQAAQAILDRNPSDPAAKRLMAWVTTQEHLPGRDGGAGPAAAGRPAAGNFAPAAGGQQTALQPLERKIQGLFRRGNNSQEFRNTLQDAQGFSVAELKAAGIQFAEAKPGQKDAVVIAKSDDGNGLTISIRKDALATAGDSEARGAANVANGVRQAQTKRDHPQLGGLINLVRGWTTGATVHKELAPGDIDHNPTTQPDKDLMASRKILDQKTVKFDKTTESYGGKTENEMLDMFNSISNVYAIDILFQRFLTKTDRAN